MQKYGTMNACPGATVVYRLWSGDGYQREGKKKIKAQESSKEWIVAVKQEKDR